MTVGEIAVEYGREPSASDNYTDYLCPEQSTTAIIAYHSTAKRLGT
ncbi:hypothetical protein IQ225_17855 [Synechocystis salina LEGE 06155]|nr:hypothetical protein [Synechocystis salina LEGE 06155]